MPQEERAVLGVMHGDAMVIRLKLRQSGKLVKLKKPRIAALV